MITPHVLAILNTVVLNTKFSQKQTKTENNHSSSHATHTQT